MASSLLAQRPDESRTADKFESPAPRIDLDRILVVRRLSKLEYLTSRGKPAEGSDLLKAHSELMINLEFLKTIVGEQRVIEPGQLTHERLKDIDIVVALGGDDHFKEITAAVEDQLVLGVNADPTRSEGALTSCTLDELPMVLSDIAQGKFNIQEWTRLDIYLNGKRAGRACSEVFIGERERFNMSHHRISYNNQIEEQKGSGLIVATGAGSTGWYKGGSRYVYPEGDKFSRLESKAAFVLTEPYTGIKVGNSLLTGHYGPDQALEIESLNDDDGIVIIDAYQIVPIPRGTHVSVSISSKPLRVIQGT